MFGIDVMTEASRNLHRQAALIALAPGADAITDPVFLHGDLTIELVALDILLQQHFIAPGFEEPETALQPPCASTM